MFVKICGITNEDDALFAVAMGADAVGFVFAPSPRQIAPQQVFDITRRLPPEILTVGVFRDELPRRVIEIAHKSGVKAVQLHGRETPEQTAEVAGSIRWVIKAFAATSPDLLRAPTSTAPTSCSSTPRRRVPARCSTGGSPSEVPDSVRLILAGGLDPDNVADAIARGRAVGRRCVVRRRGSSGTQGPDEGATIHRQRPRRRPHPLPRPRRHPVRLGRRMRATP